MLEKSEVTREQVQSLIRQCFADRKQQADQGYSPLTCLPNLEIQEQSGLAQDHIMDLQSSIAVRAYPPALVASAAELCEESRLHFATLPEHRQQDVLEGLARVMIEQQRLFLFRLDDRLLPYEPADPLFASEVNCTTTPRTATASVKQVPIGPTVAEAVTAYLAQGAEKWTAKTHAGRTRQLHYVEEHFGSETQLTEITAHEVRTYRNAIKRLRSNHHRTAAKTFAQRQTENAKTSNQRQNGLVDI